MAILGYTESVTDCCAEWSVHFTAGKIDLTTSIKTHLHFPSDQTRHFRDAGCGS
jgi:hypothetical protein